MMNVTCYFVQELKSFKGNILNYKNLKVSKKTGRIIHGQEIFNFFLQVSLPSAKKIMKICIMLLRYMEQHEKNEGKMTNAFRSQKTLNLHGLRE